MTRQLTILTGASRGMGLAMALQLLKPGATLLCMSRSSNASLDTAAKESGATLIQWEQDLAQGEAASARLALWLGQHDGDSFSQATLINNAGLLPRIVPLRDASAGELATTLRVCLEAPMQLTAAFLQATSSWAAARKVLNVSSGLGQRPAASQSAYCAAKAGLDHFTRCLALDEAQTTNGAKVCSLAPGVIDTDMQVQLRDAAAEKFPDRASFVKLKESGQLTSPEAAASRLLAYLARADFGSKPVADVREA